MITQRLNPEGLHKPIACYSQVVRRANTVAASGMASIDEAGNVVGPTTSPHRPSRRSGT